LKPSWERKRSRQTLLTAGFQAFSILMLRPEPDSSVLKAK
jgi:hypothetical protein